MISLVLSLILTASPQATAAPNATQVSREPLALTIGGEPVTTHEFARWLVRFRGESLAPEFVETWALEAEAKRLGIEITDEAISQLAMEVQNTRIEKAFNGNQQGWLDELGRENRTVLGATLSLEQNLRKQELATEILKRERRVTEDSLRRAWVYKYGVNGHTIDARVIEIEVDVPPAPPAATLAILQDARNKAIERARETAVLVRSQIVATNDFAKLARKYSAHDSARRGGSPLNGFIPGEYSFEVTEPLAELSPGDLSEPILGMGAWWIIQVDGVRETPFESVVDELREAIVNAPPSPDEFSALHAHLLSEIEWEVQPAMWAQGLGQVAADDVVIKINDVGIDREEYSRWLRIRDGEVIAQRFVDAWIIERKAQELKISLTNEEILKRIEREQDRLFHESREPTREAWIQKMPGNRTQESVLRDMLITHPSVFLAEEIYKSRRNITDVDIWREWEARYGINGKTRDARMIRIQVVDARPPRGSTDEEYARVRAIYEEKLLITEEIYKRLENGEDFGALARKYSDDESKERGGEVPEGFNSTSWPSHVGEAFDGLDIGGVTEVLEVGASLYIFELLDYRHTPLEDVRDEIKKQLEAAPPTVPQLAEMRNILVRDVQFTIEPNLVR